MARSEKKWLVQYIICVDQLRIASNYMDNQELFLEKYGLDYKYLLEELSKSLRNAIIFDNQVKGSSTTLKYKIPNINNEVMLEDHLIGMSNIVLYIIKNKLYDKWESVQDFKNTLNTLQTLIWCPKSYNNNKNFKKKWLFNYDEIEMCIQWNKKLKDYGIDELEHIETGELVSVEKVYSIWFTENKMYF